MASLFSDWVRMPMKYYGKASLERNDFRGNGRFIIIAKGNKIEGIEAKE